MHQSHAPTGIGRSRHLPTEPAAEVTLQVLGREGLVAVIAAPEVLLGEGYELQVTIGEGVVDACELRADLRGEVEGGVGVEMEGVVEQR